MKILLIDGFSILNRAFYALPLLSSAEGEYTNAVYGFMTILLRFLDEEKPDYVTIAFDTPVPTFRHNMYGAYKGTRKTMPDELRTQIPLLKNLLETMGIHLSESPGFEADDILGTLAKLSCEAGLLPVIVTGDKDMLQLATDTVKIRIPRTKAGKTEVEDYFAKDVVEKVGVTPAEFIDVKALMGDTSDNIPGVPGIGEVTATKIIKEYGNLENAIANAANIKPKKASENLATHKDLAILSRELATIVTDVPVELVLTSPSNIFNPEAFEEVKRLELKTLYKRFTVQSEAPQKPKFEYTIVSDTEKIKQILSSVKTTAVYVIWSEIQELTLDFMENNSGILGMAIAADEVYYFPSSPAFYDIAKEWLEGDADKVFYDIKAVYKQAKTHDITIKAHDIMLAAYVDNPTVANITPQDLALRYNNESFPTLEEILENKGKRTRARSSVMDLSQEKLAEFATNTVFSMINAWKKIEANLTKNKQWELYFDIELPLAYLLADIEETGIGTDTAVLKENGKMLDTRINTLTAEIISLAGEEFNINSPAQLGTVLFEKLGLKGGKKTTKGFSTAAEVLEKIKNDHPIVPLILEYRTYSKLKSTYIDSMLPLVNPVTSRIHTTFRQALTDTGRLSSAEPNLQNIPIRLALGRELRKAFVPSKGRLFIDADYSQIELRLLAHISGDPVLINAFREGIDIHRLTASQVFGKTPEEVTSEERSRAKAVNFGIVYGLSGYGLSEDLGIHIKEAERYIKGYFETYPGVKAYLDEVVKSAKDKGYAATIFNRRRPMPELKSSNFNTRSFGERVAMNMPIQGSAADIMKIAMINTEKQLKSEGLQTKIVLQVHDELLLDCPLDEVEKVKELLKNCMESAAALDIPLTADVKTGENWHETK